MTVIPKALCAISFKLESGTRTPLMYYLLKLIPQF